MSPDELAAAFGGAALGGGGGGGGGDAAMGEGEEPLEEGWERAPVRRSGRAARGGGRA